MKEDKKNNVSKCITITKKINDKAKKITEEKGISFNAMVRLALLEWIEKNE